MKKRIILLTLLGIITTQSGLVTAMKQTKIAKQNKSYLQDSLFANPILLKKRVLEAIKKNQTNNVAIMLKNKTLQKKLRPLTKTMICNALKTEDLKIVLLILKTFPSAKHYINQTDLESSVMNATLKKQYSTIKQVLDNNTLKEKLKPISKDIIRLALDEDFFDILILALEHFPEKKHVLKEYDNNIRSNLLLYFVTHDKKKLARQLFSDKSILTCAFSSNNQPLISYLLKRKYKKLGKNASNITYEIGKFLHYVSHILKETNNKKPDFFKQTKETALDILKSMPRQDLLNTFALNNNAYSDIIRYVVQYTIEPKDPGPTLVFAVEKNHFWLVHMILCQSRPNNIIAESFLNSALEKAKEKRLLYQNPNNEFIACLHCLAPEESKKNMEILNALNQYLTEYYPSLLQEIGCICQ